MSNVRKTVYKTIFLGFNVLTTVSFYTQRYLITIPNYNTYNRNILINAILSEPYL